jgi:hypothetical protein
MHRSIVDVSADVCEDLVYEGLECSAGTDSEGGSINQLCRACFDRTDQTYRRFCRWSGNHELTLRDLQMHLRMFTRSRCCTRTWSTLWIEEQQRLSSQQKI